MFEEETIIKTLQKKDGISLTKLKTLSGVPFYFLKFYVIPKLLKEKKIRLTKTRSYTYVYITEKGGMRRK